MIRGRAASTAIAICFIVANGPAWAFCSEPSMYESAPSAPYTLSKPSAPFCLSGYQFSGRHSCSEWEIQSYIDDVNRYIRDLNDYADSARRFADAAINFANEAQDYAACEARDAKSELR